MKPLMTNGSSSLSGLMMPGMSGTLPAFGSNKGVMAGSSTMGSLNPLTGSSLIQGGMAGQTQAAGVPTTVNTSISSNMEWAVPKQSKLKYNQVFNSHDQNKTGLLSGNQARFILTGTGLSHPILAQIWNLSDVDKDGKLTQEEFVLAMYLTDQAKLGNLIPNVLPPNLVPPSYRKAKGMSATLPPLTGDLSTLLEPDGMAPKEAEPAPTVFATFEDKRRDNFNKGNIELERRRQALEESQRKERERLEQKEREEREKRERERLEQERKRQAELERQLEKQRAAEREREEARKKAIEQREAAQREMERQRQLEWERLRRQELLQQKLREQENVTGLHAKTKQLDVELAALKEKKEQLSIRLSDIEAREKEQKMGLDTMNKSRDLKLAAVAKRQEELKGLSNILNAVVPEKQSALERLNQFKENQAPDHFVSHQSSTEVKKQTLFDLRNLLDENRKESTVKLKQLDNLNSQLNKLREDLNKRRLEVDAMNRVQQDKVRDLQEARRAKEASLMRKNSMEKIKKQQQKAAAESFTRLKELKEVSWDVSATAVNKPSRVPKIVNKVEQKQVKPNYDDIRKQEDEIKKEDVKRRIAEMQQKRLEQKKMQEPTYATVNKSKPKALQPPTTAQVGKPEITTSKTDTNNLPRFKVLYDFVARNPDELSISEGDIVTVHENEETEPGWLSGSLNGQKGWFPENYVERSNETKPPVATTDYEQNSPISPAGILPPPQSAKPNRSSSNQSEAVHQSKGSAFSATNRNLDASPVPGKGEQVSALKCRALYPWSAKKENHLTFEKDSIIIVSEQQAMWWFGSYNGKSGWFPKSYVTEVSGSLPNSGVKIDQAKSKSPSVKRKAPEPPGTMQAAPRAANDTPSNIGKDYVASFTFAGIEKGDLSFEVGDVITVTHMDGDWWTGSCKNNTGIFPANYVTLKEKEAPKQIQPTSSSSREIATVIAPYTATAPNQLSLQMGQIVLIKKKNDSGWWEGELQARGKKKQTGWFPANYVKVRTSGQNKGKAPSPRPNVEPKQPDPICHVMAMYDYTAQNDDEMTFSRGAVLSVTDRNDDDWWSGYLRSKPSVTGVFPSNYVREISAAEASGSTQWSQEQKAMSPEEIRRQQHIHELIVSEESYIKDLEMANEGFRTPLKEKKLLSEQDLSTLFVNWTELIMCNAKLVKAFRVRRKNSGDGSLGAIIELIGDILCEQLPNFQPYVRFCSCQLNASTLLQEKIDNDAEFKKFVKTCESGSNFKGLPVSSYLVKPMQRITKYPLLIEKILKHTPEGHIDHNHLKLALERAEEICSQVNEGVREKENADRLEWIQTHVQLDGLNEKLVFNSKTNCLGQRRFLHCGTLYKHKSNKDLVGFLFNDFLLFTTATRPLNIPVNDFIFSSKNNLQFRLYKTPVFLNEVLIRLPTDPSPSPVSGSNTSSEELAVFHLSHVDRVYTLRAENINERTAWTNKIKNASQLYIDTEKKKREKAYHARSQRSSGIGRLMVTIVEGCNLVKTSNGRHDPYCEVTMGVQRNTTKTIQDTLNPKWSSTMQFYVKDTKEDVLCVSVFQKDMFSPDDFLGRAEIKVADIKRDISDSKGPLTKKLLLHEVESGEVVIKVDLQLFDHDS